MHFDNADSSDIRGRGEGAGENQSEEVRLALPQQVQSSTRHPGRRERTTHGHQYPVDPGSETGRVIRREERGRINQDIIKLGVESAISRAHSGLEYQLAWIASRCPGGKQ